MAQIQAKSGLAWNYDMAGEGRTVVFLHGWGVNMMIWRQQFKFFNDKYRVMIVDLPGHGRTKWQQMGLGEMAEDLVDIFDQLKISKVTIAGSSFGGLLGLKVLEKFPERISSMSLCGTQPKLAYTDDNPYGLEVARIRKLACQVDSDYPSVINIFFRSLFTKEERASRRFRWLQTFRKTDVMPDKDALENMLDILEKEDLREVLYKAEFPIQFINGTEDHICPIGMYGNLKERLPQARFDWFHRCGHFPFISKPHEFNECLEGFLKETDDLKIH